MAGSISALRMQRNGRRVNVIIDGAYAFALEGVLAANLWIGQELSDAAVERLLAEDLVEEAARRCAGLIARRPRSVKEIERYLRQRRVPQGAAERVLRRLADNRLVDDAAFAKIWVDNRQDLHPRSRLALRAELRTKGVAAAEIENALAGIQDEPAALAAARRKTNHLAAGLSRVEFLRKVWAFLALRGFDYETAREAGETVWKEYQAHARNTGLGE